MRLRRVLLAALVSVLLPGLAGAWSAPVAASSVLGHAPDSPDGGPVVVGGGSHTCLLQRGTVRCFGVNTSGQLGLGDTTNRGSDPSRMGDDLPTVRLGSGRYAMQLALGEAHSCALFDDGSVKCWGSNAAGQLGLGDTAPRGDGPNEMGDALPAVDLGTGRRALTLAAGQFHTCAILDDHTVKCWGMNNQGQLGLGDTVRRGDGPNEMGDALPAVDLGAGRTAFAIATRGGHTCAILDDDTVKCWGNNAQGELGLGNTSSRGDHANEMGDDLPTVDLGTGRHALTLAAGHFHTCAILDDHTTKCWGYNAVGQLGLGDTDVRGDDPGEMGDNLPTVNLGTGRTALAVTSGDYQTCTVLDDHALKCWGFNWAGQLGLGDTADRGDNPGEMGDALPAVDLGTGRTALAVTTGSVRACAFLDDHTTKCWGLNAHGELGLGDTDDRGDAANEMGDHLPAIDLPGDGVVEVVAGVWRTCARFGDGRAKCWGMNGNGQLGLGDTADRGNDAGEMGDHLAIVDLGTDRTARALALGTTHSCAIRDDGTVVCWGRNNYGQLGLGDTADRGDDAGEMGNALSTVDLGTGRTARALALGFDHSCALLDNSTVKCWGLNAHGELGLGDTTDRGNDAGEMGDALPAVNLGTGRTAREISANLSHTCALLDDGTVKCWGYNGFGRLGLGDTADRGDDANEMGDALPAVDLGTGRTAHAIRAGGGHSCAILDDGTVKCWGLNSAGQLGLGASDSRGDDANEMGDALPAVDFGTGRTARAIDTGGDHTCALLDDGSVTCWGMNLSGQLGVGDTAARGDDAGEMGNDRSTVDLGAGRTARLVTTGSNHTCALLDDGTVKCWGMNLAGQLGLGDADRRGDGAGEMGNALPTVSLTEPPAMGIASPLDSAGVRTVWFVVAASETVHGLTNDDLWTTGTAQGCTTTPEAATATDLTVEVTCATDGTVALHVRTGALVDETGNRGPAQSASSVDVAVLDPAPTITWTTPGSPSDDTTLHYGFTVSEVVSDLGTADFVVSGTAPGCVPAVAAFDGLHGTVDVHCAGRGTVVLQILAGAGFDGAGQPTAPSSAGPVVIGPPKTIAPVAPARLLDTRTGAGGVPRARIGSTTGTFTPLVFHAAGRAGVPTSGVAAVSLNLTVVEPTTDGYATVYPCGTIPDTSSVNFAAGRTTANAVTTPLSATGDFCVIVFGDAHVIADITGWYAAGKGFNAVAPARLYDTRTGTGGVARARIGSTTGAFTPLVFHAAGRSGVPANGAAAVSLNLTVVEPTTDGYATVYPCGTIPDTSSVNFTAGRTTANAVTTPLSATGDFCVIVFGDAHVIADITGWYAAGAGFGAVTPARLLDTRTGTGGVPRVRLTGTTGLLLPLTFHAAGRGGVPGNGVAAISVNLTVVEPATDGYATIYPCGTVPDTSSVNFTAGVTTANAAVVPLSGNGDFCVIVFGDAHVIVDVNGWYGS